MIKTMRHVGWLACLAAMPGWAETKTHDLPGTWPGDAGNPAGAWTVVQVWPDNALNAENHRPLAWNGKAWAAAEHTHAGDPQARVEGGSLVLSSRGPWPANQDYGAGQKLAALVFTAPARGLYRAEGTAAMAANPGGRLFLYKLPANGAHEVLKAHTFTQGDRAPRALNTAAAFLDAGDRLVLVPQFGANNAGSTTVEGFRIVFAAADKPPAVMRPPAKVVIEGEQIDLPADAGARNVTLPAYGAAGDGVTDDTAALQKAIAAGGFIYLPNGTYLVSRPLRGAGKPPKDISIQGQSTAGVVIKLQDNLPEFNDPGSPQYLYRMSWAPAQAFRTHIRNVTFDTGTGNAAAIGLQWYGNNQASIHDLVIRSGDGAGAIGLDLGYDNDQGPCLVRNVKVVGFNVGVSCAQWTTVTTLEHITVERQNQVGFRNRNHCVAMRGFRSVNTVPAFANLGDACHTALIDAELIGPGAVAITNEGGMFLRNIKATGYKEILPGVAGPSLAEWTSHPVANLFGGATTSLNLPVKETPALPWGDTADWVSVRQFAPTVTVEGEGRQAKKVEDWTTAIQAAVDAGKPTVYFPNGTYRAEGTVHVRGKAQRIIGFESTLAQREGQIRWVIEDGAAPFVRFERFNTRYSSVTYEHVAKRPVVLSCIVGGQYLARPGAGDAFFEDICMNPVRFQPGQNVWYRQADHEADRVKIVNDGAALWILGMKTEGYSTAIVSKPGARTEVIGGMFYANNERPQDPLFINLDGSRFAASFGSWTLKNSPWKELVVEQRGETTKALRDTDAPTRGPRGAKQFNGYGNSSQFPLAVSGY